MFCLLHLCKIVLIEKVSLASISFWSVIFSEANGLQRYIGMPVNLRNQSGSLDITDQKIHRINQNCCHYTSLIVDQELQTLP